MLTRFGTMLGNFWSNFGLPGALGTLLAIIGRFGVLLGAPGRPRTTPDWQQAMFYLGETDILENHQLSCSTILRERETTIVRLNCYV